MSHWHLHSEKPLYNNLSPKPDSVLHTKYWGFSLGLLFVFFFSHGGIIRYLFLFQHTAILFNFPGLPVQNNFWPPSFRSKYVLKIQANVGLCPVVWWSCLCIDIVKFTVQVSSVQLLSRVQLCNPMDCGTPGFPIHHQLQELSFTGQWDSMVIF